MGQYQEKISLDGGQLEIHDEFGQQIFAESDEPDGIMISMEIMDYDSNPCAHLSIAAAKKFAEHILTLIADRKE